MRAVLKAGATFAPKYRVSGLLEERRRHLHWRSVSEPAGISRATVSATDKVSRHLPDATQRPRGPGERLVDGHGRPPSERDLGVPDVTCSEPHSRCMTSPRPRIRAAASSHEGGTGSSRLVCRGLFPAAAAGRWSRGLRRRIRGRSDRPPRGDRCRQREIHQVVEGHEAAGLLISSQRHRQAGRDGAHHRGEVGAYAGPVYQRRADHDDFEARVAAERQQCRSASSFETP